MKVNRRDVFRAIGFAALLPGEAKVAGAIELNRDNYSGGIVRVDTSDGDKVVKLPVSKLIGTITIIKISGDDNKVTILPADDGEITGPLQITAQHGAITFQREVIK